MHAPKPFGIIFCTPDARVENAHVNTSGITLQVNFVSTF